jgi:hypothetical protein
LKGWVAEGSTTTFSWHATCGCPAYDYGVATTA